VRSIRPGYGMSVKEYGNILGLKVKKKLLKGTALKYKFLCK